MECCRGVARVCIQIVRWLPVCILMAAASWGYYAYVFQLTFGYMEDAAVRVSYLIGFHFLLVMFLWSYFSTVFAKLRSPPMNFFPPRELLDELSRTREDREASAMLERYCHENNIQLKTKAFEGGVRYCPKCRCLKPDRAHHCSVCGQCVLKFDHHCPWVNTCVSFDNYKFFILFLGYAFLFCLWVMLCDLPFFIEFWNRTLHDKPVGSDGTEVHWTESIRMRIEEVQRSGQFHLLFLFFVSGMFAISVSVLFFYHLYLTANNLTTVESFRAPILSYGPDKKAFHLGIRENYRQVFGSRPLLWFVPINTSEGDGCKAVTRVGVSDPCVSADLSGPAPSGPAPYSYSSSRVSASEMV